RASPSADRYRSRRSRARSPAPPTTRARDPAARALPGDRPRRRPPAPGGPAAANRRRRSRDAADALRDQRVGLRGTNETLDLEVLAELDVHETRRRPV